MKIIKVLSFLFFCLLLVSVIPAGNASGTKKIYDPGQIGPYAVGHSYFMLNDPSRNASPDLAARPVAVDVWYPVDKKNITPAAAKAVYVLDPYYSSLDTTTSADWELYGIDPSWESLAPSSDKPFPLVMFSPGWGCPAWLNMFVATRVASHGFVVAVMYHYADAWWPWEPWDHLAVASLNRPLDVSFVLSDLLVKNQMVGNLLYGLIKSDQIAASGHSLGGYASMVLAGGDPLVCDFFYEDPLILEWLGPPPSEPNTCVPALPDSRIKAIVLLDGSNQILHFQELAQITIPTIGIGEEWDILNLDPLYGGGSWQARQHAAIQGHPCYRVDVAGAIHMTFTNLCEAIGVLRDKGILSSEEYGWWHDNFCQTSVPSLEVQRLAAKYMVAFLKTNLAREQGYQSILTPGYALTREQFIEFFVTEKRNPSSIDDEYPDFFVYFPHQPGSEQFRAEKDPKPAPLIRHARIRR